MNGLEKKRRENNAKSSYVINIADYDDNARYLIGWPGYRNGQNKSGLGYVETQAEMAHIYGLFIKWLMTGKFRTRNPFYLLAITLIGVLCGGLPTILILYEIIVLGNGSILRLTSDGLLVLTISDLLLINAILSIINRKGKTITGD
jgi:hypothetical protein